MNPVQPSPADARKAAVADLLGEAAVMLPPVVDKTVEQGEVAEVATPVVAPSAPAMPEPPPAEDENQPGFIGERNRPAP
ncbi:MAG: hypothetical protein Q8L91_12905 [Polaromonas sp.]|nr:hypothetical protein [Polaromonas sp.]